MRLRTAENGYVSWEFTLGGTLLFPAAIIGGLLSVGGSIDRVETGRRNRGVLGQGDVGGCSRAPDRLAFCRKLTCGTAKSRLKEL